MQRDQMSVRHYSIALIGLPADAGASRRGAGMGPEMLRIARLCETLESLGHTVTDRGDLRVGASSTRDAEARKAEVLGLAANSSEAGMAALAAGELPVFLGGDHSIAMGSIAGVARHCAAAGTKLFVLWVDAHGDFNTPLTSGTGNLHGMPLALLCGEPNFGPEFKGDWLGEIDPHNVTIFGARSIDREERDLLEERGVDVMDMRRIDEQGAVALMRELIAKVEAAKGVLHVSFDADAIDPAIAPGTGTPVQGGLTYREAHLAMEMLYDSGLMVSLDVVELNPYLDHAGRTADLLVDLVASLFGRQIMRRQGPALAAPRP